MRGLVFPAVGNTASGIGYSNWWVTNSGRHIIKRFNLYKIAIPRAGFFYLAFRYHGCCSHSILGLLGTFSVSFIFHIIYFQSSGPPSSVPYISNLYLEA